MLQSLGLQRVGTNLVTDQQQETRTKYLANKLLAGIYWPLQYIQDFPQWLNR